MELTQLRELVAVCDEETLSRAAASLHLSPSSLSRSMKGLESELRISLFDRTRNSITPNSTGLYVAKQARSILEEIDSLRKRALDFERRYRTIRIGSCAPAPAWLMLTTLAEHSPNLIVSSEVLEEDELEYRLSEGMLDVIILSYPMNTGGLRSVHLLDEALLASVPNTHRLAARKTISFADLDGETVLVHTATGFWGDILARKLPHSDIIERSDYMVFLKQALTVQFPALITDAPTVGPMEGRTAVEISDPEMHASFYAVMRQDFADRWEQFVAE